MGGHEIFGGRRVEIVRSPRRKRTISAEELAGGVIRILLPAGMSAEEEAQWVDKMVSRLERRRRRTPSSDADLTERAAALAARYDLPAPASIRWVDNQRTRWGSCTVNDRAIRLSSVLIGYPDWVIDYVIVHEMAHLVEPTHSPRFWKLVARYPRAERARGFLMAKELDAAG
jgi:predicted metal-dependent hydrolase